eukprot:3060958-Prymnesium_polylepis.1
MAHRPGWMRGPKPTDTRARGQHAIIMAACVQTCGRICFARRGRGRGAECVCRPGGRACCEATTAWQGAAVAA